MIRRLVEVAILVAMIASVTGVRGLGSTVPGNSRGRRLLSFLPVPIAVMALSVGVTYGYDAPSKPASVAHDITVTAAGTTTTPATNARIATQVATAASQAAPRFSASSVALRRAAKGGTGAAQRTVTALTREQDAGLRAALKDPNKFRHVFDNPRHKLDPLVDELGGREFVLREAVLAVPRSQTGIFEVTKQLGCQNLTVRGRVVNGVPRIGTVFVP